MSVFIYMIDYMYTIIYNKLYPWNKLQVTEL